MEARSELIFGFPIGGEGYYEGQPLDGPECPDEVLEDWETVFAEKNGLVVPSRERDTWSDADNDKYYEDKRRIVATAKGMTTNDGDLGSGCTTEYVTHVDVKKTFDWEGATEISPKDVTIQPHWEAELKAFCDQMGIPWGEPKMCIICSMG